MAIKWKSDFSKNPNGHYSAIFSRYDEAEPDVILNTVNIGDAILETKAQEKALWDFVYARYEKKANRISADSVRITELQEAGSVALNAKEVI